MQKFSFDDYKKTYKALRKKNSTFIIIAIIGVTTVVLLFDDYKKLCREYVAQKCKIAELEKQVEYEKEITKQQKRAFDASCDRLIGGFKEMIDKLNESLDKGILDEETAMRLDEERIKALEAVKETNQDN